MSSSPDLKPPTPLGNLKALLHQASHYLTGRGIGMAISMISFPVFARLLPVADYGILNLAQRFTLIAVAVAKLGMQNSIIRFHDENAQSENGLGKLYSTSLFSCVAGALICSLLCAAGFATVPSGWIQPQIAYALLIASGLVFMRAAVSPIYGFLRVEGRTIAFNVLDVVTRLLSLLLGVGMVLWAGRTASSLLLGLVVAEGLVIVIGLVGFVPRNRLSPANFDVPLMRAALVFGLPLAGSELAQTLLGSGDRPLVQYFLGSEQLGYYAAATAIAALLQDVLQLPLNLALTPIYMKIWHNQGAEATSQFVSLTLELFLMAACAIVACSFATARELIVFISSAKYAASAPLLGPLVLAYLLLSLNLFFSVGFWVRKKTIQMAPLVIGAFFVRSVMNVFLLPTLGLWGAVIPALAGNALMLILYGWFSHRLLPLRISARRCLGYAGAAVAAAWVGSGTTVSGLLQGLAVKGMVTLAVYAVLIWAFDARVRQWTRTAAGHVLQRCRAA